MKAKNTILMGWMAFAGCLLGAGLAPAELLERIISREDPKFDCASALMRVGLDGNVYLSSGGHVLRVSRDGAHRLGGDVVLDGVGNATANADGIIAVNNAHFQHHVHLYDRSFKHVAECSEFKPPNYDSPRGVEAGESGDFYGLDYGVKRVLRISPTGKIVKVIEFPGIAKHCLDMRVSEAAGALYLLSLDAQVHCLGFDGVERWAQTVPSGGHAVWTVDAAGTLYAIERSVKRWSAAGTPLPELKLEEGSGSQARITQFAVAGDELLLKRADPAELFQVYDLATGKFKRAVQAAHERVSAEFPSLAWTAGEAEPFTLNAGSLPLNWHVRATPFGDTDWRELKFLDGKLQVPADYAGLYQVRIAPTLNAEASSEYTLRIVVEVRAPDSKGTVSVWTPLNRVWWGRGEAIPVSVAVRTTNIVNAVTVTLREIRPGGPPAPAAWASEAAGPPTPASFLIPASFTAQLSPGRYELRANLPGFTCVSQPIRIGDSLNAVSPFRVTLYGDYGNLNPTADAWSFADTAVDMLDRSRRLGVNQYVNRMHPGRYPLAFADNDGLLDRMKKRLMAEPDGVATQKVEFGFTQAHVLGAFSAHGIREWLMLVYMDSTLPMGTSPGYCGPITPDGTAAAIKQYTEPLRPFPAFAGWDWAANWWAQRDKGTTTLEEKAQYEAAVKQANATGTWSPVLDTVGNRIINWQPETQQCFKDALDKLDAHRRTASSGPYRRPEVYPPVCFSNVDEVDLHFQAEQITTPNWTPHAVDFYKRPGPPSPDGLRRAGKPAWIHPEFLGDTGTGEQILPMSFLALMRGADGIGKEGAIPQWGPIASDPRSAYAGMPSVYRALNQFARAYGPWLGTLENADGVAIPVSFRHVTLDSFGGGGVGGVYFTRLWTAYQDCLYARRPATFVFAEDKPDLTRFKAVLLVGLRYEPEPAFHAMVETARKSGATIFADASCRESLVKGATPLDLAFNEKLGGFNEDIAYWNDERTFLADAPKLAAKLAGVVPPVVEVDQPCVLATLRRGPGGARYLWLVNNARTTLEPGVHWRVSAGMAATLPVVAKVRLPVEKGEVVYDVFSGEEVAGSGVQGSGIQFDADLRFSCARLYAILPTRIGGVKLDAPKRINPGVPVVWQAGVLAESSGTLVDRLFGSSKIRASLPLQVRLLDGDGSVVEERFTTTGSGAFNVPVNGQPPFTIAATELISGKSAGVSSLNTEHRTLNTRFGPHLRDLAVSADGKSALFNAFNWGQNLYSLDLATGKPAWSGTIGDHFAFSPVAFGNGFAAQGFDLATGEGYHLYVMDAEGRTQRRFALPGLPARMVSWCFTANLNDHIANFAVAPDSSWVAAAGNLALAAWKPDGTLLWSQDWSREKRQSPCLLAADAQTLLTAQGMQLCALDPRTGKSKWALTLDRAGEIQGLGASADGKTLAVRASTQGGRVFVVRDGKILATIPTGADAVVLAPDGTWLAATTERSLKVYTAVGSPLWSFAADSLLRFPRAAADGKRLAVSSELGTLYVLDIPNGRLLHQTDLGAIATTAWLPDGDLLAATWMGTVVRFEGDMHEKWLVHLADIPSNPQPSTLNPQLSTARITSWSNAERTPWPLTPNLFDATNVSVEAYAGTSGMAVNKDHLFDGNPTPPEQPRLGWHDAEMINSGWRGDFSLVFDTTRTQLRVNAITLVEDPAHPESWIRDARLEYWDVTKGQWVFAQYLTSDVAVHTHQLVKPIEARKFRLAKPDGAGWGTGNLWLAEVVFHGDRLGCSQPDALANRPVAVLFDEKTDDYMEGADWRTGPEAFSGAQYLAVPADRQIGSQAMRDWDFEIVEKPEKPGQYRWLQFTCKALAPETQGAWVMIGQPFEGESLIVGNDGKARAWASKVPLADKLSTAWTTVRVDLWKIRSEQKPFDGKPMSIRGFLLDAVGGSAAFDRILLGRTEADLKASRPIKP